MHFLIPSLSLQISFPIRQNKYETPVRRWQKVLTRYENKVCVINAKCENAYIRSVDNPISRRIFIRGGKYKCTVEYTLFNWIDSKEIIGETKNILFVLNAFWGFEIWPLLHERYEHFRTPHNTQSSRLHGLSYFYRNKLNVNGLLKAPKSSIMQSEIAVLSRKHRRSLSRNAKRSFQV